ncbi:MAG: hypothetical protein LBH19_00675 [Dysgonamonadaceae bacterium]|jgi:glycosylphosphatidylinositol transamidase (GPIT) subunit GPI8|nr:hypothetical protein [Dysgonamonadaceae bacterium]
MPKLGVSTTLTRDKASPTLPVIVKDNSNREITLRETDVENGDSEYYITIESPIKLLKESAMQNQFSLRFEEEMSNIEASIHKKATSRIMKKFVNESAILKRNIQVQINFILLT